MNYKKTKEEDTYIFTGNMRKNKKITNKFGKINDNPFKKLLNLNIK